MPQPLPHIPRSPRNRCSLSPFSFDLAEVRAGQRLE
jgi:hypothetical protein